MLDMADVRPGEVVYDLGCGDGRIPVTAAKKYGSRAWGFDINPVRVKESLENVDRNNVKNLVTIKLQDIFELDLSKADVITLYLLPQLNVKLIPQLDKLKPGCRIVSNDFDMKGVRPKREVTFTPPAGREHRIFLWETPLEKERQN
jgi:ribosomal protein L11 methylase PrmA